MEDNKEKLTLEEFKEKVEKINHLKSLGFLSEKDLEKFKKELLDDIKFDK